MQTKGRIPAIRPWHGFRTVLMLMLFSLIFTSCNLEKKIARSFVEKPNIQPVMVMLPDYVFKSNLKEFEADSTLPLGDYRRDSILMARSLYLQYISDSDLIARFSDKFVKTLQSYKFQVLPEQKMDSLLQAGTGGWLLNLAQVSVEEYIHPYSDRYYVGDEVVTLREIDLNALNLNIWLEWSVMNGNQKNKVLFASDYYTDKLSGSFQQAFFSTELLFEYSIDTLTVDKFYQFCEMMGEKCAAMFYDYLMNMEISRNLPENYPYERQYYHYDPRSGSVYPIVEEDRLIELDR